MSEGTGHECLAYPLSVRTDHPQNACAYIDDANGEIACLFGGAEGAQLDGVWQDQPRRDARARLFVTAVNSHSALMKCAEALAKCADIIKRNKYHQWEKIEDAESIAREALSLLDEATNG